VLALAVPDRRVLLCSRKQRSGILACLMPDESTTPDLMERIRVIFEAIPRRDWDAILAFYAPDAVWQSPGVGKFEGHAAMRGIWDDWSGLYEDWRVDLDEGHDLGNGVVLASVTMRGRLSGSGGEVRERAAWVYEWVDGLIERVTAHSDIDEARAAAERLAQVRGPRRPRPRPGRAGRPASFAAS
jgi:ketosteroid isomerase-like protein